MLQALTEDGQLLTIAIVEREQINKYKIDNRFFCPVCHEQVIIKAGIKTIAHFAHKRNSNCSIATNGEGEYHEQGKLDLFHWLKLQGISVQLEKYLPTISQRPDMLVTIGNKKIAIEYQCASLPLSVLIKRTQGYLKENIIPIWILGGNRMKRLTDNSLALTSRDLHYMHQFNQSFPITLYYYCPNTKEFARFQNISLTGSKKAIGNLYFSSLRKCTFLTIFQQSKPQTKTHFQLWLKDKLFLRTVPKYHMSKTERQWRKWLYLKRLAPSNMPAIIYLPVKSQWRMKVPPWNWQSRLCIDFLNPKTKFTIRECQAFLQKYIQSTSNYPLIYPTSHPITEYLDLLIQLGFVIRIDSHYYQLKKKIEGHPTLETAIQQDNSIIQKLESLSRSAH